MSLRAVFPPPPASSKRFPLQRISKAELGVSPRTAIGRSADLVNPEVAASPSCMAMLRQVFTSGRVSATLRDMNELNILGRVIPEFGELIAFFQHNVYHYYSADEHTLIALARVEGLMEEGLLHKRNTALAASCSTWPCSCTISPSPGVSPTTRFPGCPSPWTSPGASALCLSWPRMYGFLVRHHLAMEQIAFRKNIYDPETIRSSPAALRMHRSWTNSSCLPSPTCRP